MQEYTSINVHVSLRGVMAALDLARIPYVVVDGPLGESLEADDGRDVFLDSLIESGLIGEMSWTEISRTCQELGL